MFPAIITNVIDPGGEIHDTEGMFEPAVGSARIDEVGKGKLMDFAEALERLAVEGLSFVRVEADEGVNGIADLVGLTGHVYRSTSAPWNYRLSSPSPCPCSVRKPAVVGLQPLQCRRGVDGVLGDEQVGARLGAVALRVLRHKRSFYFAHPSAFQ